MTQSAKSIFITGGSGFIGSKLISRLQSVGHTVTQLDGDLLDFPSVKNQIDGFLKLGNEKVLIHLAGLSSPPYCEKNVTEAFKVNVAGTSIVLESIRQIYSSSSKSDLPHFIFASTAHVYDMPADGNAITEKTPIKIKNVYGETKIQAESIIADFSKRSEMPATILRLFNHVHISQSQDFLIPSLFHQIKNLGPSEYQVKVGNLDLYRDMGSIPDLLNALQTVVEAKPKSKTSDVYNVCAGQAHFLLDLAKDMALYLKRPDVEFVIDNTRVRTNEIRKVLGSFAKIKSIFGWSPTHTEFKNFFTEL